MVPSTLTSRLIVSRLLLLVAFAVSVISLFDTAAHAWDIAYQIPEGPDGPRHAQFHFLRETAGSLGLVAIAGVILCQPEARRYRILWWVMALAVVAYFGGFWVGYPLIGVGAPSPEAKIVHTVITLFGLTGVLLARRSYTR